MTTNEKGNVDFFSLLEHELSAEKVDVYGHTEHNYILTFVTQNGVTSKTVVIGHTGKWFLQGYCNCEISNMQI